MAEYRRRIFLINPEFQLRFSIFLVILVVTSSIFLPITIDEIYGQFIQILGATSPKESPIMQQLEAQKDSLLFVSIIMILVLSVMVFIGGIILSHRIAGPMYKLKKYLTTYRGGQRDDKLFFRQRDYFKEVADELNLTLSQVSEDYKSDAVYISEVISYLNNLAIVVPEDKKVVLKEIVSRLEEMQNRFQSE